MTPAEAPALVALLVEAFDREHFSRWAYFDVHARQAAMSDRFTHTLETLPTDAIAEVTHNLDAFALWLSPGSDIRAQASPGAPDRVAKALESINAAAPNQPFWYLSFLGARKPGGGRGSTLLRHRLPIIDAEGLPSALWTASEGNVAFYARHGFRVLQKMEFGGASGWWLWRDVPRGS